MTELALGETRPPVTEDPALFGKSLTMLFSYSPYAYEAERLGHPDGKPSEMPTAILAPRTLLGIKLPKIMAARVCIMAEVEQPHVNTLQTS